MRFRPPYLVLAAVAQAILLAALAHGSTPPTIRPGEAPLHEGQGDVHVVGLAGAVRSDAETTRIALEAGGHRLDAVVAAVVHVPEGAWVEAVGRIGRMGGSLTLFVSDSGALAQVDPPGVVRPSWSDLAAHPEAWSGQAILVRGTVDRGHLADGDGHHVMLGAGPWPKSGPVEAVASIRYDPACLCHVLAASQVTPGPAWTP